MRREELLLFFVVGKSPASTSDKVDNFAAAAASVHRIDLATRTKEGREMDRLNSGFR
jgi:hypothetical protein